MPLPANFEKLLWDAIERVRTRTPYTPAETTVPLLRLLFLKYVDHRMVQAHQELSGKSRRRGGVGKEDYLARGVVYVPPEARYQRLLECPRDIGNAVEAAMKAIEAENVELRGILSEEYRKLDDRTLLDLLRIFDDIPNDVEGDAFHALYEHLLASFARLTSSGAGEFYTPIPVTQLIVEVLSPLRGRIYDPACGSGGIFVQNARFVAAHGHSASEVIRVFGTERNTHTLSLCQMNLAVHGLSGDVRLANALLEDVHQATGKFDFVMTSPPFNQSGVDKAWLDGDRKRFPFGVPTADNANYLWIQHCYSALNERGRAGFVMVNSASDARGSQLEIRRRLVETGAVDVVISLSPNFFYATTLPVTLWFLDRGKASGPRQDKVLLVDARHIYRQVDRARRDFMPEQVEFLANVVRLYRGEELKKACGSETRVREAFPGGVYCDRPGLCRIVHRSELESQSWSLNPSRYVQPAEPGQSDTELRFLVEEFEKLNKNVRAAEGRFVYDNRVQRLNREARRLEKAILEDVTRMLGN